MNDKHYVESNQDIDTPTYHHLTVVTDPPDVEIHVA